MFGIFPNGRLITENDDLVLPCLIIIDNFTESLHIPVSYWTIEDYKKSWMMSLKQGIESKGHSALAVSMYEPDFTNFIFTWVMYFDDDVIYVQNKILFLDECSEFTPARINDFISARETYSEDGMKISEWKTDLNSVLTFYNTLIN